MSNMIKKKLNSREGMTMAELLTVVAIVIILAGVAFIMITNHQRTLAQQERDAVAKEIFIAAQNHLTMAKGENYHGILSKVDSDNMQQRAGTKDDATNDQGIYYIIYNHGIIANGGNGSDMLEQMLPFGSIDETIRAGENYVIRYQPSIGKVMDVFYCTEDDGSKKFNHAFTDAEYKDDGPYGLLKLNNNTEDSKSKRRNYTNKSVLGWYGGEQLESLNKTITAPRIKVVNSNTLYVESWDTNSRDPKDGITIRLIITGKTSRSQKYFDITRASAAEDPSSPVVLDDITRVSGNDPDLHFATQFKANSTTHNPENDFIPGEDLEIKAIAFSSKKLANIAESGTVVENSLFDSISHEKNDGNSTPTSQKTYTTEDGKKITINGVDKDSSETAIPDTAYIKTFRHLENLDITVSNLDAYDSNDSNNKKLKISTAIQKANLKWSDFYTDTHLQSKSVFYSSNFTDPSLFSPVNSVTEKCYKPVNLPTKFVYDGKSHRITGVKVDGAGSSGLFGTLQTDDTVQNVELRSFDIKSTNGNAGTLAGDLNGAKVLNVLARDDEPSAPGESAAKSAVEAVLSAGGLIGNISNEAASSVSYSAAAVEVKGGTAAGGLIGTIGSRSEGQKTDVTGCYSSGRTECGEYYKGHEEGQENQYDRKSTAVPIYSVTSTVNGSTAGGLIGVAGNSTIASCYSTSSVSGPVAGGFVGSSSGSISNCYCTGLVSGELEITESGGTVTARKNDNAFIGSGNPGGGNNRYYSAVNEVLMKNGDGKVTSIEYKLSGVTKKSSDNKKIIDDPEKIIPFDSNTDTLKNFADSGTTAYPYDPFLITFYSNGVSTDNKGIYYLKTVEELTPTGTVLPEGFSWAKSFVKDHYGDWPAPEVLAINQ